MAIDKESRESWLGCGSTLLLRAQDIISQMPPWARTALCVAVFAACVAVIGAVDPQAVR